MVLQDLNSPDGFSGDGFSGDDDQFSRASSSPRFDVNALPRPIPVFGAMLGFSEYEVRRRTEMTLQVAERRIKRSITPEEAQALAKHFYQVEQTKSYAAAGGFGAGIYRWYATNETHNWPFYKPKKADVDPNRFLIWQGPWAVRWRLMCRLGAYTLVGEIMARSVASILANTNAARAAAADPSLSQFADDMRRSAAEDQERARGGFRELDKGGRANPERHIRTRETAQSRADTPPRGSWAPKKPSPADDDMSPTAGNEPWSPTMDSWGEPQVPPQQGQTPSAWDRRPAQSGDDASPTGGLFQDEIQGQPNAGESAWDRLRRGAQPNPLPPKREPSGREPQGPNLGDRFTFADTEEERRRAQERAQREFDASVERERQGKDFNDERRW